MLTVTCKSCGASVFAADVLSGHLKLQCGCCPLPHDHGQAAIATGKPCRPVRISPPPTILRATA